jgi:hypothetical protein
VAVQVLAGPADLLHRPDVQLQIRTLGGRRVQAALGAPCEVAAEIRFGVLAGAALEAGQAGSCRQSQPIGDGSGGREGAGASWVKVIMPGTEGSPDDRRRAGLDGRGSREDRVRPVNSRAVLARRRRDRAGALQRSR